MKIVSTYPVRIGNSIFWETRIFGIRVRRQFAGVI